MMDQKVISESTWNYTLYEDTTGELYFDVVCGTVAVYTIVFRLNEAEKQTWEAEGERALAHLAYRVRDYPEEYLARAT